MAVSEKVRLELAVMFACSVIVAAPEKTKSFVVKIVSAEMSAVFSKVRLVSASIVVFAETSVGPWKVVVFVVIFVSSASFAELAKVKSVVSMVRGAVMSAVFSKVREFVAVMSVCSVIEVVPSKVKSEQEIVTGVEISVLPENVMELGLPSVFISFAFSVIFTGPAIFILLSGFILPTLSLNVTLPPCPVVSKILFVVLELPLPLLSLAQSTVELKVNEYDDKSMAELGDESAVKSAEIVTFEAKIVFAFRIKTFPRLIPAGAVKIPPRLMLGEPEKSKLEPVPVRVKESVSSYPKEIEPPVIAPNENDEAWVVCPAVLAV